MSDSVTANFSREWITGNPEPILTSSTRLFYSLLDLRQATVTANTLLGLHTPMRKEFAEGTPGDTAL
jgi:hypothetical protein